MKKSLLLCRWLFVAVALMAGTFAAQAATNLGVVEANQDYNVPGDWGTFDATYVATTSGPTSIVSNLELKFYTDPQGNNEVPGYSYDWKNNKDVFTYDNLEAGTYYLHLNFCMNDGTFRIETEASTPEVKLVYINPETADYVPAVTDMVTFRFDCENIDYSGAKIIVKGTEYSAESYFQLGGYLNVLASKKLVELANEGIIAEGDQFKVRVEGVCDANNKSVVYNGDGVAEKEYTLGALPTSLLSASLALYDSALGQNQILNPMNSYYRAGDEAALVTLEFSKELKADCSPVATFSIGDPAYETKYYQDEVAGAIDGNKVTFDMSGVTRHWKNWPSGLAQTTDPAGLKMIGILDCNGNPVYSGDTASPNSFSASLQMTYLEYPVESLFTPVPGSKVADGDVVSVAVTNGQHITFDGVKFEYTKDGEATSVEIPAAEVTVEAGANSAATLSFNVPALGADQGTAVNVSLANIVCDDGFNYEIAAEYAVPSFEVTLVSPADGATLANIKEAGSFKVNIVDAPAVDEMEVMVRFYDPAFEDPQITGYMFSATPEEGEELVYNYAREVYEDYDMLQDVDYTVNITVNAITYPAEGGRVEELLADKNYTLHGAAVPFIYSDATLVRISPNPVTTDIISTDQNLVTMVFDAPVVVTKAGSSTGLGGGLKAWTIAKYEGSTMLDENLEEVPVVDGTVWTITIPESTILASKSTIPVSVWVEDTEGHPVYKTSIPGINEPNKNKENTYYNFEYVCTVGAPDFTVEPFNPDEDGFTVVSQLDKIYVSYSAGIDPNWNNTLPVVLYKGKGANQETIQEWKPDYFDMWNDDVCVEYTDVNLKWCIALDEPITEPGAYYLIFPNAFFNLGSEYNQSLSRITNVKFLIEAPVEADNIITDPIAGSTVESLEVIKITWVDAADASVDWNISEPVNVYDADNNVVTTGDLNMSSDWDDPWNMLILTLNNKIDTDGEYTIHIPAGKVTLNDGSKAASEQFLKYTVVSGDSGINGIEAGANAEGDVYGINGVRIMKAGDDTSKLVKGIYIINGRKVVK